MHTLLMKQATPFSCCGLLVQNKQHFSQLTYYSTKKATFFPCCVLISFNKQHQIFKFLNFKLKTSNIFPKSRTYLIIKITLKCFYIKQVRIPNQNPPIYFTKKPSQVAYLFPPKKSNTFPKLRT